MIKIIAISSTSSCDVISCIPFLVFFVVQTVNGETLARVYAYMRVYMCAYVRFFYVFH